MVRIYRFRLILYEIFNFSTPTTFLASMLELFVIFRRRLPIFHVLYRNLENGNKKEKKKTQKNILKFHGLPPILSNENGNNFHCFIKLFKKGQKKFC